MKHKLSLRDVIRWKSMDVEKLIEVLDSPAVDIFITPDMFEDNEGCWYQPDVAILRNKDAVLEDLRRNFSGSPRALFYLAFCGRRVKYSLHEEYSRASMLMVDNRDLKRAFAELRGRPLETKLQVSDDCSYIKYKDVGYRLCGCAKDFFALLVSNWTRGVREVAANEIMRELNQTGDVAKLFRDHLTRELYKSLIMKPRHGYYALKIERRTEIQIVRVDQA